MLSSTWACMLSVLTNIGAERDDTRQLEEDLWVARGPLDFREPFLLVEVTSEGRGGASEDHCGRIARYLLRRRREFSNLQIRGLLVINHQYRKPAHMRQKLFSDKQIQDAERDGYGLISTYELFKAIELVKFDKVSKDDAAETLLSQSGVIEF